MTYFWTFIAPSNSCEIGILNISITKPLAVIARSRAAYSLAIQRIVKDAPARVVADLAETMLKDGYIHFDEKLNRQMGTSIRATVGVVPKEKVLPVKEQLEQL